jgi:hypothetical protein
MRLHKIQHRDEHRIIGIDHSTYLHIVFAASARVLVAGPLASYENSDLTKTPNQSDGDNNVRTR